MRCEVLGNGPPEIAVVGGIHGDEPCGPAAIDKVLAARPAVERPVAFVIANEAAIAAGDRFVDTDLNRAFPGDHAGDTHEERLAARLGERLRDCTTLSLHSTQSFGEPFGIVNGVDDFAREIAPQLPIVALVDAGDFDAGRLFESVPRTIEVECGFQGSEAAAENAVDVTWAFLRATGAIETEPEREPFARANGTLEVFRLEERVPKRTADTYEVHVANFDRVAAGEAFAETDGDPVHADAEFYPVLMSSEGYEELFGYTASFAGTLPSNAN